MIKSGWFFGMALCFDGNDSCGSPIRQARPRQVTVSAWVRGTGSPDTYYTGDIDQVAIFNQPLAVDRIWNAVRSFFPRPAR